MASENAARRSRKLPPPGDTGQEAAYLRFLSDKQVPVTVKLRDGESVSGWIEYFDDRMIRLTREGRPKPVHLQAADPHDHGKGTARAEKRDAAYRIPQKNRGTHGVISQLPDSLNLGLAVPAAAIAIEAGLLIHDFSSAACAPSTRAMSTW